MKLKDKILANKFKAIYAKDNSHPIVNMQLYVKMGSGWESDEQEGFTHLLEHLVLNPQKSIQIVVLCQKLHLLVHILMLILIMIRHVFI